MIRGILAAVLLIFFTAPFAVAAENNQCSFKKQCSGLFGRNLACIQKSAASMRSMIVNHDIHMRIAGLEDRKEEVERVAQKAKEELEGEIWILHMMLSGATEAEARSTIGGLKQSLDELGQIPRVTNVQLTGLALVETQRCLVEAEQELAR